jgi:hypothetical protein
MPAPHKLEICSHPPLIDMWGQSLDDCCAAQEVRRIEVRATSTAASSSNTPSPNKTPRKKTRSFGYCQAQPFPLDIPALQQNYGGQLFPVRPPMIHQQWMPPQWDDQLCVDNFPTLAIHNANVVSPECDWAKGWEMPGMQNGRTNSRLMSDGWVCSSSAPHVSDGVGECRRYVGGTW